MVSGDHKSAALPRVHPGGNHATTAQHGGTVVINTTAPSHTSAVRRKRSQREVEAGAQRRHRRVSAVAMVVQLPPQKSDEGDQEKEPKPNRLGPVDGEGWGVSLGAGGSGRGGQSWLGFSVWRERRHGRASSSAGGRAGQGQWVGTPTD